MGWFDVYRYIIGKDYKGLTRFLKSEVDPEGILKVACREYARDQISEDYLKTQAEAVEGRTILILEQTRARMEAAEG